MNSFDILIAGVGGQGTILTSRLLAEAAVQAGRFARTGETIGMAQRGGCVVSHVRIDSKDVSPYIPLGSADLVIAFEYAEAARNVDRLKPDGKMVVNMQKIEPVTVTLGGMEYDAEAMKRSLSGALFVDGYELAEQAGSVRAINVVLLGAALGAGLLPFSETEIAGAMQTLIPERFLEMNLKALKLGCEYVK